MRAAQRLQLATAGRLKHNLKMSEAPRRPFYAEYAWAFDLLIDRPVEKECGVIAAWLVAREILPGAGVLDAGCGTGR